MERHAPTLIPTHPRIVERERLGDEIALLSPPLDAATARLLDLIRAFDARGGWNTGFRSCGAWLSWRGGLGLGGGPARGGRGGGPRCGRGRRAGARGARPRDAATPGPGSRPWRAVLRQGSGADPRGHAR